ncbi:YjiH family protein [Alkalicoccus daliensis]|uniref:Nucleoside recognition GATE domain-containing membrane protein YjiH n=1 Tax=Alkalicoccus daliensis TaxID=745820 RepID=A0A1H0K5K5_9BACI|nr:YjiH family protein [Alkalicoccus daliensis]SDO51030.1 nucleoside recognition GATE domain-containing membrane protein YjiH [Alkalicoccus daliensis]
MNERSPIKFIVFSLLGVLLFMTPIPTGEGFTIPIAVLSSYAQDLLGNALPILLIVIILASFIGSAVQKFVRPASMVNNTFLSRLFDVSYFWFAVRLIASVLALMTYFQIGPEFVWSENTGGLLFGELLPTLFTIFFFAGLFLPLLLNFGLLEFFGGLLTKIMRPLFTLPGRSSIDSLTSWLGDGTIGVILTDKQYQEGYYSQREAAVIGTTFSVVSITFALVIIEYVELQDMFFQFYGTVIAAGFITALIMPRIPPLSRKSNQYANGQENQLDETLPESYRGKSFGLVRYGYDLAIQRAAKNKSAGSFFSQGGKTVLEMWLAIAPIIMAFGTIATILAEFTPLFSWLGAPFVPILQLMQVPEAAEASATMVVGFADMFLPAVFAAGIESDMTRFIIACVSVTQLIFLSEVGGVLLGSKIPVSFLDLLIIFLERTLISLPIIVMIAHLIF